MSSLPTGTVTFLFTDIQGSTRLWEQHPAAMPIALARHDDLLRGCIEDREGYVFKTIGDAFCAAFPTANQALEAALAAQFALAAEPWETGTPLQVRMALHTGSAEERGGDYFGQPLNRAARLMAAGHGGQVLLSEVTQGLVRDALPPNASLLDLSRHRLKDLGRPEQIFQLRHPSLPAEFPPLSSLDNPDLPNNLPQQATSFIGREKQVEEVKALLTKTRLLTLMGAGGSGKTRLSLQVAADLLDGEGDGVWLVELAGLSDPVLVPQAVADVLGVKEAAGKSVQQSLTEWLKPKRLLLILDNCEHLVSACASLAADLLRSCPDVHLLASSREALNVAGEQTYRVPTLTLPDPKKPQTAKSLSQYEAVRLFIARAQAVQPSFSVTDANAPAVAQVCWRLDGIPLALELAAARVRSLPVEQINTRLDQRFRLLTGGSRTALPRQQTLRALVDWSYDLLTEPEKTLLRRVSVFASGWSLAAAEEVCSGEGKAGEDIEDWEVLDLLTALTDKSLVVYEDGESGEGRSRLLETVRQYAGERLTEAGEAVRIQGSHFLWCLALAQEAEPQLMGPEQGAWLSRLEAEHDNLRAGLAWNEQRADGAEEGVHLAGSLWRFWLVRGHLSEGRQWLGRALERTSGLVGTLGQEGAGQEGAGQEGAGQEGAGQEGAGQEEAAGFEALATRSKALNGAGNLAVCQGDYAAARTLHEEALTVRRQLGDQGGIGASLNNLGIVARVQGDYAAARTLYEESLIIKRRMGDQQGIAASLTNLGNVAFSQGDYAAARTLHEESLTIRRRMGDQQGTAVSLNNLGNAVVCQGDHAEARTLLEESLTLSRQLGDQEGIAGSLEGIAGVASGLNQMVRAIQLWGAASSLRETIGCLRSPAEQEEVDEQASSWRTALGEDAFTAAWDTGQAMTLEQAVEYALSAGEPPG